MTNLETALKEFIQKELRPALATANIGSVEFYINSQGRTESGEVEVTFTFGYGRYEASGGDLRAALEEHLRRNGWVKRNAPLCLPSNGD